LICDGYGPTACAHDEAENNTSDLLVSNQKARGLCFT
jgi:hypothetical protein